MGWRIALVLGWMVLAIAGPPGRAGADALEEQAERQLGFAEEELAAGEYSRAVKSAESALRLAPTLYTAFVVKALAYEGLENHELAESLLIAYQELTKGLAQDPRVAPALSRLRDSKSGRQSRRATDRPSPVPVPEDDRSSTSTTLDPAAYQARVEDALKLGQCANARAAATELTLASPGLAVGWRLLGDGERCVGNARAAIVAYRRYQALGGDEPAVLDLIDNLAQTLGTLEVQVALDDPATVPLVRLHLDGDALSPIGDDPRRAVFADLPPAHELTVLVAGRGLAPSELVVEPLGAGERRSVRVEPEFIGLATVKVTAFPEDRASLSLVTADEAVDVGPGEQRLLTAGEATALVTSNHGEVEVPLRLDPGGSTTFDPTPWLPAELTLVDLPAGSDVRVFVEGSQDAVVQRTVQLASRRGAIDPASGVRLAPPTRVDSLLGGVGGLFVTHPVLGDGSAEFVLQKDSVNAWTFDWRRLDGVDALTARYETWSATRSTLERRRGGAVGASLGATMGSAVASGLLWGLAVKRGQDANDALGSWRTAADAGDASGVASHRRANEQALADERALAWAGSLAGGLGVVGAVVTVIVGVRGQRALEAHGEWEGQ